MTGIVETIRYFIGTAIGILNYAKYTLSEVPDINLKRIYCLSGILITTCDQMWKLNSHTYGSQTLLTWIDHILLEGTIYSGDSSIAATISELVILIATA